MNDDLTALSAVLVWHLVGPLRRDRSLGETILLFLGWTLPILARYLNINGIGVAPLIIAGVFAFSVCEVGRERAPRQRAGQPLPAAVSEGARPCRTRRPETAQILGSLTNFRPARLAAGGRPPI